MTNQSPCVSRLPHTPRHAAIAAYTTSPTADARPRHQPALPPPLHPLDPAAMQVPAALLAPASPASPLSPNAVDSLALDHAPVIVTTCTWHCPHCGAFQILAPDAAPQCVRIVSGAGATLTEYCATCWDGIRSEMADRRALDDLNQRLAAECIELRGQLNTIKRRQGDWAAGDWDTLIGE